MLAAVERWLDAALTVLLVLLLATMVGVAVVQIVGRNLVGTGLIWGDDLVRVAVLWVTMVGATVAAGDNSHIHIDVVARFAGPKLRAFAERATALFTAVVCAALGWYSIEFIRWDFIDGVAAFASVPAWVCESVIPVASSIIALRYLVRAIRGGDDEHPDPSPHVRAVTAVAEGAPAAEAGGAAAAEAAEAGTTAASPAAGASAEGAERNAP